ncbi:MAG: FliA/WhiG family RNA polymerase sigma factor [Balneolaceae bacterium]|nr:MAG: FliA/WhiG family RNA polymerase sigma factor [Balneolaceae bacterium]
MCNLTLQELVESYCNSPADVLRNSIISKSMPLIRSIIGKINRPNKPLSQREDLESAGITGLIQALDTYEPEKNIQFNTYAYYRIRGSVIDYLRKVDSLPRKQRKSYGEVQGTRDRLSQEMGREPSDEEIAKALNMPLGDYHQLLSNVQQRNALSLDNTFGDDARSFYDIQADPESSSPDQNMERKEIAETLKKKIGELNERERLILTLYYYEDLTMSEVALLLDLSEARISQIVGKLLIQLKAQLIKEEIHQ